MLQRSDRTTASFYDPNHNKTVFFGDSLRSNVHLSSKK